MTSKLAAKATRVAAGDDRLRYDGLEMAFHWATALLVVTLWLLAQAWDFLPRGGAGRHTLQALHVSLGLTLAVVLLARILWRLGPGRRLPPASAGVMEAAARAVHYLLYALLVAEVGLGLAFRWAQHEPLAFFGLFSIGSPLPLEKAQAHTIGEIHEWVANTILVVAGLHALAALFHHYVLHDDVLWRMLPGRSARRAEAAAPDPRSRE